jgi:hypothetical protein
MRKRDKARCPSCGYPYKVVDKTNFTSAIHKRDTFGIFSHIYKCTNIECNKIEAFVEAGFDDRLTTPNFQSQSFLFKEIVFSQRIFPQDSGGKPEFRVAEVPEAVFQDYDEACKIVQISPRASATLARRCIQNMIRIRFGINGTSLENEIKALQRIKEPVRQEIIDALHHARNLGNIGAHPSKEVKIVIDISEEEAGQIISAIEVVLDDWFLEPARRDQRIKALKQIKDKKDAKKNAAAK